MDTYQHLTRLERESVMLMHRQGVSIQSHGAGAQAQQIHDLARIASQCRHPTIQCLPGRRTLSATPNPLPAHTQIHMRPPLGSTLSVSFVTIYRAIRQGWLDRGKQQALRQLRHKGKRRRKSVEVEKRGKIVISHPLAKRPISAAKRSRFGHWEVDTVAGRQEGGALLTLVERRSRYLLTVWLPKKNAQAVEASMLSVLRNVPLHSITPDRARSLPCMRESLSIWVWRFIFRNPPNPGSEAAMKTPTACCGCIFPSIMAWANTVKQRFNLSPTKSTSDRENVWVGNVLMRYCFEKRCT